MAVLLSRGLQTQRTWTLRDENTGEENETMRKPHFSGTTPQNWVSGSLDPKAQDSAGFERQAGPHSPCPHSENGGAGRRSAAQNTTQEPSLSWHFSAGHHAWQERTTPSPEPSYSVLLGRELSLCSANSGPLVTG